jgi:iron complex outermembrane receptor protein
MACASVVALCTTAGQAWAQEAQPPAASDRSDVVVVTAQRRTEDIQDVPVTIQAFTADDLQNLGVKDTTDLSQFTPNVAITNPAGKGNQPIIVIRGIGLNDYNTNNAGPNGVYIDEFYISPPSAQGLATFDLARIEVLKGPQGTLYGRNASGGAINLVTAKPTDVFTATAHAEYSTFNTFNFEGAVGGPIADGLTGRFAATTTQSEGYFDNTALGTSENGQNNVAARAQLQWDAADNLTVLFALHGAYVDNRPNVYRHMGALDPVSGDLCSASDIEGGACVDLFGYGTPEGFYDGRFNRRQHLRTTDVTSTVRVDYDISDDLTFTSLTGYEYNRKNHPEDTDVSTDRLLEINFGAQSNTTTQEFRLSHQDDSLTWVAGAYYLHEALKQFQPLEALLDIDTVFGAPGLGDGIAQRSNTINHQTTDSAALFGQLEYNFTDAFAVILGGRYTWEQKDFSSLQTLELQSGGQDNFGPAEVQTDARDLEDSQFSWRLGANYTFSPETMAFASVATGFKSGGFNGGFLSDDPIAAARQRQPVKAEEVTAYEIGVKTELLDGAMLFNASVFYNDYKNQQLFALLPPLPGSLGPVNALENAEKAHTQGVDLQITWEATPELNLTANIGLLETELDKFVAFTDPAQPDYSGNELPLAPEVTASLFADWQYPVGPGTLKVQANSNYRSSQFFDIANTDYMAEDAYWVHNLRVAYALDGEAWEVAAFVRNLSDEEYFQQKFDLTNPFGYVQGVTGMPRTVGVELNLTY